MQNDVATDEEPEPTDSEGEGFGHYGADEDEDIDVEEYQSPRGIKTVCLNGWNTLYEV